MDVDGQPDQAKSCLNSTIETDNACVVMVLAQLRIRVLAYASAIGGPANRCSRVRSDSEAKTEEFVAKKHGLLFRRAWLTYLRERLSIKPAVRHLGALLIFRVKAKFERQVGPPGGDPEALCQS